MKRAQVKKDGFNMALELPYALRLDVFGIAITVIPIFCQPDAMPTTLLQLPRTVSRSR